MSAVDNSRGGGTGGGGGGKDKDDFSKGKGGSGSGGGDDRKKDDNNNHKDTNNNWRRASRGESVAGASNNSASSISHGQTTQSPDQSEQFRQDMEQATRDSIQHTVGAYSVVPGSVPSRREVGDNSSNISPVINTTDGNGGAGGPNNNNNGGGSADVLAVLRALSESGNGDASALLRAISESGNASGGPINANLPLNIDFIAEATLVPHEQQQQERNDAENDVDTIGLPPHAAPEEGGAIDNDGVSYISAITNPTTMDDVTVSRFRETPTIPSAIVPPTSNNIVTDEEAQIRSSTVANSTAICENNNVLQASSTVVSNQDTQHLGTVYEAEIVEDGPMHVLRSKYGKVMCGISIAIILVLSLGLAFGLTYGRSKSNGEPPIDDPNQVLNYAGGNFCNSGGAPYLFDYEHEPFCSKEDVMLGGTIQQAVAIAQRRPHPYCPEGKEGTETTESLCSVSKSTPQISLVNGGAIRGEIAANTPITREMVRDILPFTSDTIAYVELMGSDVVQVLENALAYVTRESPLNPYLQSGYPYASGLKFDVNLTSETKVSNVRVLNSETGEYAPIDPSTSYWMVTNRYLAENGDGYLTDVTPLQVAPTELGYTYELEQYLIGLSPEYWVPPTLGEMSTTSFNATGVSIASVDDVPIEYFESEPGQ